MTPKRLTNFLIDPELSEGLKAVKARDGIPEGEQIRRGIRLWLKSKGVAVKAPPSRLAATKRKG